MMFFPYINKNKGKMGNLSRRYYYNIHIAQASHRENSFRQESLQELGSLVM